MPGCTFGNRTHALWFQMWMGPSQSELLGLYFLIFSADDWPKYDQQDGYECQLWPCSCPMQTLFGMGSLMGGWLIHPYCLDADQMFWVKWCPWLERIGHSLEWLAFSLPSRWFEPALSYVDSSPCQDHLSSVGYVVFKVKEAALHMTPDAVWL
jgi:hypothetical protein